MNLLTRPLAVALLSASVAACVTGPDGSLPKDALDDALNIKPNALPSAVEQELLQVAPNRSRHQAQPRARRFNIAANNVEAKSFFNALANQHGISMAVHPDVTGSVSLNLRQATLDESLTAISELYGYGIEQKGGVYQVFPNGVRSKTFNVNYLMLARQGQSQTAVSGSGLVDNDSSGSRSSGSSSSSDSTRINTESNNDFWVDLESALSRLIGNKDDRVVITNPQAGLVSVRANPAELAVVEDFLGRAEKHLKRQVVLEARIIEVELNDGYEQGIDWAELQAGTSDKFKPDHRVTGGSAVKYPGFLNPIANMMGGGAVFNFTDGNFTAAVKLLETQGEVNTLSNPRVTTSNNQKAVIKVGTDEYYVTNFTLNTTTSNGVSEQSPDLELSPFFSGVSLDVTPQISGDNKVLLHIHPSVSEVTDNNKEIDIGQERPIVLPLARSSVRESDTIVEARSGEMIVIGGLMQEKQQQTESGIPVLSRIPLLGNLFKNQRIGTKKSELVILLRPVVVAENTWTEELQRSRDLLEKWYPPKPDPIRTIDADDFSPTNRPQQIRQVDRGKVQFSEPAGKPKPIRSVDRGV